MLSYFAAILISLYVAFTIAVSPTEDAQIRSAIDWMSQCTEGLDTVGNHPTADSGVTIGVGVDLGQTSRATLAAAGVSEPTLKLLDPYFGYTSKAAAQRAGVFARNLKLPRDTAWWLSYKLVAYAGQANVAFDYGSNMSSMGRDVLMSLRHWVGSLGCSNCFKLAPAGTNWVWQAVAGKSATDQKLAEALGKTIQDCKKKGCQQWHIYRLTQEQKHASGNSGC